tara:strand:+ start:232 stop:726 length:495 start_codon:yes stop_codon:yes gene_type:complete
MGLSIKPLMGDGEIVLVSLFDEAVDWEASSITQDEYIKAPWGHAKKLPKKADSPDPIIKWHFRAPRESDLAAIDSTTIARGKDGEPVQDKNMKAESADLFRRCLTEIEDYYLNGKEVKVKHVTASGGVKVVEKAIMEKIPYEVAAELGMYLRAAQELSDDLKND